MRRRRSLATALLLLLLVGGCCGGPARCCTADGAQGVLDRASASDPVEAAADRIQARAQALEPLLTPRLTSLAARSRGELAGLQDRLKSRRSILSRIRRRLQAQPTLRPADAKVRDAVRYTLVFADEPAGHHVRAVRACLAALEREGQRVVSAKNFWERGDAYAGVNVALIAPGGMLWELQFHTPASFALKSATHLDYEREHAPETPLQEKRALFDKMTVAYDALPVPTGILEPKALHARARMRTFARP